MFDLESSFHQAPPELANTYDTDPVLRSYLRRALPPEVLGEIEGELREMGELAAGELYELQLTDRRNEPQLIRWDAWGRRVDRIEVTELWRRAEEIAARRGVVATAYERRHGAFSRIHQFALAYLFSPSVDIYGCPLAMTDGAARTLIASDNEELIEHAVPRLTSREPEQFWTSGQWMTETAGGSDVGRSQTVARREGGGWRLYGRKWFTSAAASQIALTLARPEDNPPGGRGLALFYVEPRDEEGRPRGLRVERLKDKLGTRKVPTAELLLDGMPARLVAGPMDGVKHIAPMLNVTRIWNAVSAAALLRRGLTLAQDYAHKRVAFGAPLADKPLHVDTLAGIRAELEGAFQLTFRAVELLGASEADGLGAEDESLARVLTLLAKLTTAKQAVAGVSEVLEAFGGAGYVEDTGLPALLRDAQVLPIWEGTTNVLSLELLRTLERAGVFDDGPELLQRELDRCLRSVKDRRLTMPASTAHSGFVHARDWLSKSLRRGEKALESGARRFALTLGRTFELALLVRHAQWALKEEGDEAPLAAARRLASHGVDLIVPLEPGEAEELLEAPLQ